jgi:crotonobetainyl-CoA:carnitine CoA-transferase CaiB-like acyl-CoA transferase
MATGLLADYGADVISVMAPGYADSRSAGGAARRELGRVNARNKRSLLLDLKNPAGQQVLYRLVKDADGIMESNRPGVARRLGIDYDRLRIVKPDIVYCALTGFGQTGPYARMAAHDLSFQGVAGTIPVDENGIPSVPSINTADRNAAYFGAMAMLMALLERSRSGKGQFIDVAFTDVTVQVPPGRMPDEMLNGAYPCYNLYETADGRWLNLSVREPIFWERLLSLMGKPEWLGQIRPAGPLRDEMFAFFASFFRSRTLDAWIETLREADIEFGPVNRTLTELAADPHLRARDMVLEAVNPVNGERTCEPGLPLKFSRTPGAIQRGPTLMGLDTDGVLRGAGYGDAEIESLREAGVIGTPSA